jgi:geranylgeranylglycerol-phosphate geranylgeranyltransferase
MKNTETILYGERFRTSTTLIHQCQPFIHAKSQLQKYDCFIRQQMLCLSEFLQYNDTMKQNKFKGMLQLFRPELAFAAGICVVAGQFLAIGKFPSLAVVTLGFLCAFSLSSTALILNDVFDYEVDKINMPQRPLPSGVVSRTEAIGLTAVVSLIGLSVAFALGPLVMLISVIFWLIGILYNWRFKQSGLPGNLMVSASVAITFVLGAVTVQDPWNLLVWVFSIMAFLFNLGEEIAGDAMDMEGDQLRHSRSLALRKGKNFALRTTAALWAVLILLSFLPLFLGLFGTSYLIMIVVVGGLIVFWTIKLLQSETSISGHQAIRGVYLSVTLWVIALLIIQAF